MEKGIDRNLIDIIMEETEVDQREQIRFIIEKKYKNFTTDEKYKRRAISGLQRKGFSWDDIKSVMSEYEGENYGY